MKQKGFTLLETVIAIGILIMVGGVAVGASSRAINTGTYSKNRTRAQDLARRQIEGLKALRDTNYQTTGRAWDYHLTRCAGGHITGGPSQSNINFVCNRGGIDYQIDSLPFHVITRIENVEDDINGGDNGPGRTDGTHYPSGLDENKNMRRVTVTVTWSEPFLPGSDPKVELTSYLTNDKIGN
ncbi:MAG: type II secretion system protein [Candidatus Berkelbacteria bacterium]|nr:type II secretion system protein [Candidatus Berkelbacteria bacterium]